MVQRKTAEPPLLTHWSYYSLTLSHRYVNALRDIYTINYNDFATIPNDYSPKEAKCNKVFCYGIRVGNRLSYVTYGHLT